MHKRSLCRRAVSVCLSIRPSRWCTCTLSKRINVQLYLHNFLPSGSHTILVFPHQTSWRYSDGASNAGGIGKNRDSRRISGYWSHDCCSANNKATVQRAVYRTDRHASVNLYLSQPAAWTTTTKRMEQNIKYLYAAVNLNRK